MSDSLDLVVVLMTGTVSWAVLAVVSSLCLALRVGLGVTLMGGLVTGVTGERGTVTSPPRDNVLKDELATLGTVGTEDRGVVKLDRVGWSGTAGTGWRAGLRVPMLATGRDGTAGTGSGNTFCTGAIREAVRGLSRNDPRWMLSASALSRSSWKLLNC